MLTKNILSRVMFLLSLLVFTSCTENGPKGTVIMPDQTIDETVEAVLAAQKSGWLHEYDVELHYRENGKWKSAGMFSVYKNMSKDAEPNNRWVDFGEIFKLPADRTDYAGYSWCVMYKGVKFYW